MLTSLAASAAQCGFRIREERAWEQLSNGRTGGAQL